jgi:hypothetical protein
MKDQGGGSVLTEPGSGSVTPEEVPPDVVGAVVGAVGGGGVWATEGRGFGTRTCGARW